MPHAQINADLLAELQAAHQIIRNALNIMTAEQKIAWPILPANSHPSEPPLNIMTAEQKIAWAVKNVRDVVDGEGATRANEREAVINRPRPMPKTKPLLFEPETASEMDLWAAQQLAALATEEAKHESKWPGQALREAPQAPQIFRGHRSWVPEPMDAPKKPKPAPKIPRNTEPCPLWQFVAIFLAVGSAAFATAAYGLWWLQDLLKWAGL